MISTRGYASLKRNKTRNREGGVATECELAGGKARVAELLQRMEYFGRAFLVLDFALPSFSAVDVRA